MSEFARTALGWLPVKLLEVATFRGGNGFPERFQGHAQGLYPFIKVADLSEEGNEREIRNARNWLTAETFDQIRPVLHPPGAIVFAKVGAALKLNRRRVLTCPTAIDNNMMSVAAGERLNPRFLFALMQTVDLAAFCQDGGLPSVNQANLGEFSFLLPSLDEQRRMIAVLEVWDEAIGAAELLSAAKRQQFEYIRAAVLTGRARLPGFTSEWVTARLSDVLTEHSLLSTGREEVFSVSVHRGLVNQVEHLGRSFAASSTDHYWRVRPGDVVYTKSPTGDFPLGIIKQSKVDRDVIVSPLYGVFTPETPALGTILDAYFSAPSAAQSYLAPLVQKGAKNTIAVTNDRFLEGSLRLPRDRFEQEALSTLISVALTELDQLNVLADHLRLQKRGLMQKLLTGEWRAPVSMDALLPAAVSRLVAEAAE